MRKVMGVVAATVLLMAASAQATVVRPWSGGLIRVDLGGNGAPAEGFVEYKAASTLAQRQADDTDRNGAAIGTETESNNPGGVWFGPTGSNIWDARDGLTNGAATFTRLKQTSDGMPTGVSLAISNANRSNDGQATDWRATCAGTNAIQGGGFEASSIDGMSWVITGLKVNTVTELWIYANDKNYSGTAYTVNDVSLISPPSYGGNWTLRDLGSQKNGFGWGMTVTTDATGTLTGWAKQGAEIRGLQIYQAVPEPATVSLLALGGVATLIRRRHRA